MLYNPQLKGAHNFVPGVIAIGTHAGLRDAYGHFHRERKRIRHDGNLACFADFQPTVVILSKAFPYLILSLVNVVSILIIKRISYWIFLLMGACAAIICEAILFIITCLALGL